jgi:uncharacterized protein
MHLPMAHTLKKICCPTCKAPETWRSDNSFKPFCSERCKLIDLGEWAQENYRIPDEPVDLNLLNDPENEE